VSAEQQLAYWINERWAIHVKKDIQNLPKPWSSDPIFQRVRFCNVHREDDAVTKWMRENWNRAHDPVWKFVLGRMMNLVDTLAFIPTEPNSDSPAGAMFAVSHLRDAGDKIFTSAYTISTCGKSMDKLKYVQGVLEAVEAREFGGVGWPNCTSLATAWKSLCEIDGLGSFLAAQVVADMKNTPNHALAGAVDWWSWSAPGPGSLRGLNWFFYGSDKGPITPGGYDNAINECWEKTQPLIDTMPRIGMQDFQNCLCEFSKYMKLKHRGGHARNRFQGV
jgi:hypothetical protein